MGGQLLGVRLYCFVAARPGVNWLANGANPASGRGDLRAVNENDMAREGGARLKATGGLPSITFPFIVSVFAMTMAMAMVMVLQIASEIPDFDNIPGSSILSLGVRTNDNMHTKRIRVNRVFEFLQERKVLLCRRNGDAKCTASSHGHSQ